MPEFPGPMDPDVDLSLPDELAELRPSPLPVTAAVSAGGVLGALARYAISAAWPHAVTGFPWATWTVNVSGCLLIGVVMVLVTEVWPHRRLVRTFLGAGVLGGYTTFSTSIVDVRQAAAHGAPGVALLTLGATLAGALAAAWVGTAGAGLLLRGRA
jgi:fluoride exporter